MHGDHRPSRGPKLVFVSLHLGMVLWAAWLLLGDGTRAVLGPLGLASGAAGPAPRGLLLAAAAVYWVRVAVGTAVFVRRRMGWSEVAIVASWLFVIHTTFALTGATGDGPSGLLPGVGALLFLVGSGINTGSELQRHRWKNRPGHTGRLYTGGLFRYARHINYFGDIVLFVGWALGTGRVISLVIPAIMTLGFVFGHAPRLDRYLAERYGDDYREWAKQTPRLVPWLY